MIRSYDPTDPDKMNLQPGLKELADIARMQSQRMWDAFDEVDRHRRSLEHERSRAVATS